MLRELQIHKRLDKLQDSRSKKFVPSIIELISVYGRKKPQENFASSSDSQEATYRYLDGFFIITTAHDATLAQLIDPVQRSSGSSASCMILFKGTLSKHQLALIFLKIAQAL